MTRNNIISISVLSIILTLYSSAQSGAAVKNADLDALFSKKDITILITDSGLGGIAVCADIEHQLRSEHPFRSVKIIFCNALPESDYGYNTMNSTDEKIQVFSDALSGMTKWYSPDIILIACNTLSVLYERTAYAKTASIPVISIVDIGVEMMADALKKDPNSSVIIYGTETTIEADSHRSMLVSIGIAQERIVTQACPDLAGEIQSDAASDAVATMIDFYSDDAVKKLKQGTGTVYAGLCCTHFGYASEKFQHAVHSASKENTVVIDPTGSMREVVFPKKAANRFPSTAATVNVVSRAAITPGEVKSIGTLVQQRSAATASALEHFELKKDLFNFSNH